MNEMLRELPKVKAFVDDLCQKTDNSGNFFKALGVKVDCEKCSDKCTCFTYGISKIMHGKDVVFCNRFKLI